MPWRYPGKRPSVPPTSLAELWDRVRDALLIAPFSWLLALILGGDPEDWDTLEEIQDNLIPALIRLPVRVLVELIGGIPIIGDAVEDAFAGWLKTTNQTAVGTKTAIVAGWSGDTVAGDPDVNATVQAMKAAIESGGYVRTNIISSGLWTPPAPLTEITGIALCAGENGANASTKNGGNGGRGGQHKVRALDPSSFTSLYIELGTPGNPTRIRKNSASGEILIEALPGGASALATQFGWAAGESSAAGGGGGGGGVDTEASSPNGTPGLGRGGGQNGSGRLGGLGGTSAGAPGGAGGGNSADGSPGGSVPGTDVPCGGGGGGGGGAGSGSLSNGGDGGDGGFPGGGGGGGGGRGQTGVIFPGSAGDGGIGGAAAAILFYR